jgi:Glyoxalase-like domain
MATSCRELAAYAGADFPGAELVATHDDRGPLTYVMRDPEGNEFCVH